MRSVDILADVVVRAEGLLARAYFCGTFSAAGTHAQSEIGGDGAFNAFITRYVHRRRIGPVALGVGAVPGHFDGRDRS